MKIRVSKAPTFAVQVDLRISRLFNYVPKTNNDGLKRDRDMAAFVALIEAVKAVVLVEQWAQNKKGQIKK
jgi:hypothetical protein